MKHANRWGCLFLLWLVTSTTTLQGVAGEVPGESDRYAVEKPSPGSWPQQIYRWHYKPENNPAWMSREQALALFVEAARHWEACGVRLEYAGETGQAPGRMDRINTVGWSTALPARIRAATVGRAKDGVLLERDIAVRPDREEFRRHPRLLHKVIMHEFGHALGLTHSTRCDDVMTLAADCPRMHPSELPDTPTDNDLLRCRAIYQTK